MPVTIDIEWTSRTRLGLQRGRIHLGTYPYSLPALVDELIERAVNDYIRRLVKRLKRNLRLRSPRRTGRLAFSWVVYRKGSYRVGRSRVSIHVWNTQPYALWLDRSRRSPHKGYLQRIVRQTIRGT